MASTCTGQRPTRNLDYMKEDWDQESQKLQCHDQNLMTLICKDCWETEGLVRQAMHFHVAGFVCQ